MSQFRIFEFFTGEKKWRFDHNFLIGLTGGAVAHAGACRVQHISPLRSNFASIHLEPWQLLTVTITCGFLMQGMELSTETMLRELRENKLRFIRGRQARYFGGTL
jgi:hypothetical protein